MNDQVKGRYFYLMLKENFYDSDDMVLLESMENGYLYSNILLKLYLKSLKDKGKLMYKDRIPYNIEMLSKLTRHNVDVVRTAIEIFKQMGIIEILDNGAIYMLDIENYIGKSSTEADRKRKYDRRIAQEKQKLVEVEKSPDNSHEKSSAYLDLDIDLDLNLDLKDKKSKQKKFTKPTLDQIEQYINQKQLSVDPKEFYNYFEEGNWIDSKGNKVKNWKQKLLTWNKYSSNKIKSDKSWEDDYWNE